MKVCLPLGIFALSVIIAISCSQKQKKGKNPQSANIPIVQKADKKITLRLVGEVEFDRSYSDAQFIDDEKERDKYYKKQDKSNPLLIPAGIKDSLKDKLEKFGFVRGEELLLNRFKYKTKKEFPVRDDSGKSINIRFKHNEKNGEWKLFVSVDQDSSEIKLPSLQELKYALLDIIPDGYKEIVLLDEHYISNNELYDLIVYEIKTRK